MPVIATTRQKVIGLLAAGFAILAFNALFSLWVGSQTSQFLNHTVAEQAVKTDLTGILTAAQDAETAQRGFLLTSELPYLEPYEAALLDLPKRLSALEQASPAHADLQENLPKLKDLLSQRMEFISRSVAAVKSGTRDNAMEQLRSGRGKLVMDELRALIANLTAKQETAIATGLANVNRSESWARFINLATLLLIVALAATTTGVVMRFVRDLSEAQTELQALNTGLERTVSERTADILRANEEIQRFAYIVSHDLRAPLVNIMGFTSELEAIGKMVNRQYEALADRAPDLVLPDTPEAVKEDLPEAIGFIRASTAKMDRLINAILGLSREGRRVLSPVNVDMTALVGGIAASLQHQVDAAGGEIIVGKLPAIVTDKLAIEQIFSNVTENAIKYMEPGRAPRVEISGRSEAGQAFYRISDNGRGIEDKDRERIFELFRRAGKQDKPGEGLGLAFVRAAVRRLGGSIDVESELGKGTTFSLRFPMKLKVSRSETHG